MRYRLRTLLILVAVMPPIVAPLGVWAWREYLAWQNMQSAGRVTTGYLGAMLDDEGVRGVQVIAVRPGSPAEVGGMMNGDVITSLNNRTCRNLDEFDALLAKSSTGSKVPILVLRGGQSKTLVVTLEKRPVRVVEDDPFADPPTLGRSRLLEQIEQIEAALDRSNKVQPPPQ
jgi:predicted metalloprotease with PDZ domain